MADQEDLLIQKITVIREDKPYATFDRAFLKELTYIETADLSGPRLIFVMDDHYRIIRDQLGIAKKDVLEIVFSDRFQRDGINITVRFVILTMPIDGRFITFNCLGLTVYKLKIPAKEAIIFKQKSVAAILQKLAPGVQYDVGSFPVINDYHLLPAMRPTKLLRQMAQEYGAICFWQRGRIVFKRLKDLYAVPPAITYSHNDNRNINRIIVYSKPNTEAVIQDLTERNYIGWDIKKGLLRSGKFPNAPAEFSSVGKSSLDNLAEIPKPAIEFTTAGNGGLYPGLSMGMIWNTERPDLPIDESLPARVVIGLVAHSWKPQSYFCQVGGIKP